MIKCLHLTEGAGTWFFLPAGCVGERLYRGTPSSVTASGGATFPREGEGFGDKQKPGGDDPPRGSGPTVHSSGKGEGRSVEPQAPLLFYAVFCICGMGCQTAKFFLR